MGVAFVTLKVMPPLRVTTLLPGVVEKPKPWICRVLLLAAKLVVLIVTIGATVATSMGVPLLTPKP